jgi:hypothetical protein
MAFDPRGQIVPGDGLPSSVCLFPLLFGTSLSRYCDVAKRLFTEAITTGKGLVNWAHGKRHAPFVKKMIFKVSSELTV